MAVFVAANASTAVNMYQLFAFEPTFGGNTIDDINTTTPGTALVADYPPSADPAFAILYSGVGPFDANGTTPESGSFDKMEVFIGGVLQGTLSSITPGFGNFGEIDLLQAYNVLLGNDTITGSDQGDFLFTGDGGSDSVDAKGGDDSIAIAAATGAPSHSINGGAGVDAIFALSNIFSADRVLDLRNATIQSIEELWIEGTVTVRLLGSQIGAGLSSTAEVSQFIGVGSGGDANLEVVLNAPGVANLSGFTVGPNVLITIFGSAGADTISGSGIGETIRGDAGADTVNGNGGNDILLVAGAVAEFDAMNGGAGTDTLQVEGGGALTLNGFSAASQAIEVWLGNGQGLFGNAGNNSFDLSGLAAISGLPFIDAGGGDDIIVGSAIADLIRAGAGKDAITGGLGGDRFDFDAVTDIGKKNGLLDLIADFATGDLIDLSTIDANGSKKGDKAFKFLKKEGAKFTKKAGQLGFDQKKGNTFVQGDTNGDGKADFKIQLAGDINLAKGDFVL
jgi:Ca2+-binding RTX toxin-like protein